MKISIRHETTRITKALSDWIHEGLPLLPNKTMSTRSPSFALMVLVIALVGMLIPELFGLTNPPPVSSSSYYSK